MALPSRTTRARIVASALSVLVVCAVLGAAIGGIVVGARGIKKLSSFLLIALTRKEDLEQQLAGLENQQQALSYQLLACQQASNGAAQRFDPLGYAVTRGTPIGFALGSGWGILFIDRGTKDGIRENDWVITPERHLIGTVESAHADYAAVRTIFDNRMKISASLAAQGIEGLFQLRSGAFVVDLLPVSASTSPGTVVSTSGNDGLFPRGLILGIVSGQSSASQPSLQAVTVSPLWSPSRTDTVVIVRNIFE